MTGVFARGLETQLVRIAMRRPRLLYDTHKWLYRRTGGRLGGSVRGLPILLLTTLGRRSGRPRTTALLYLPEGDDLIVVNSDTRTPDWWRNLQAQPRATIQVGGSLRAVQAHAVVDAGERSRLWPALRARNPIWRSFQEHSRHEPLIVLLQPAASGTAAVAS